MKQEDIEKAWQMMSQHNSELMIQVADLEKQIRCRKLRKVIWGTLKARFMCAIGKW